MSCLLDVKTLSSFFSSQLNISPEPVVSDLCKKLISSWESQTQNQQLLENDLNLLTAMLSSTWNYGNAAANTKFQILDLFSLVLTSINTDHNGSKISFLTTCCKLEDPKNSYSEKLTKYVVTFLKNICFDLLRNQINCVWNEETVKNHSVFGLLEKLIETKQTECFKTLQPYLGDILVSISGFPILYNIISRLIFSSTRLLLETTAAHHVVKCLLMQISEHVCQLAQIDVSKLLCSSVPDTKTKHVDHVTKCVNLMHLILESLQEFCEKSSASKDLDGLLLHIISNHVLWCVIQLGAHDSKSTTRKAAANCLKLMITFVKLKQFEATVTVPETHIEKDSIIFSSSTKFVSYDLWLHFISVCETLEENQIHVIRPVLSKLCGLFLPNCQNQIPLSWLLTVIRRMLSHDSK